MADQEDQVSPIYSKEDMAAFEQYEKELADYTQQAKASKEHKDAGYALYPHTGAAIGAAVPLAGAATNKLSDLASKGFDALNRQPAASAGQRWAEAVGGPGGKTVDEAVKAREIQMGLKPGEKLLDGIVVDQATYDKEMADRAAKRAAQSTAKEATKGMNPKELDLLQRSGLLRKVLVGAGAGFDLGDAYRRYKTGDTRGAVISGLGALGYPISKIPYPPAEVAGYGLMFGAPALNQLLDKPEEKAKGGLAALKKAPSHFAKGGEAGVIADTLGAISDAIQEAKAIKASEALASHEGKVLNVTQSDRMRSTEGDLGGPGFSKFQLTDPKFAEAKAAWAVGKKPTATRILNLNSKYPEGQAIWTPQIGSEIQHQSNQHTYDALTDEFLRQARLGKLPPELRDTMNDKLIYGKEYKGLFPEDFDISNPEHIQQYGNTFDRRRAIAEITGGKGIGKTRSQIYDYPGILQDMADPMTIGAPTYSLGTRLFNLTGDVEHRPDIHSAFPYILKGQDLGVSYSPVPMELGLYDWVKAFKDFEGRDPGYMDINRFKTIPNQQITEDYLTRLQKAGYAKGGEVGVGAEALSAIEDAIKEAKINPQLTQRSNTVPTYSKSGNILLNRGVEGPVIDFGAGLGLGTEELKKLFPEVHDYEPLAIQGYNPKFSKASDIPSDAYQGLVNHSVLNVLDKDTRDEAMKDIGRIMQSGGTGIITARTPQAVLSAKGIPGGEINSIITQGPRGSTFQKGFSTPDLVDYAKYILGKKFDISPAPKAEQGPLSGSAIMIQKKADGGPIEFTNKYGTSVGQDQFGNRVLPQPTELDELKGMLPDRSTIQAIPKATSILGNKLAEEAKREWDKSGWRAIPDIALNTGAILGGSISDLASGFSPSLNKGEPTNPALGVGQEQEKPNFLGSEQIHDYLRNKGITKEDYPLAENALMLAAPYAGEIPGMISKGVRATEGLPVGLSIKDVSGASKTADFYNPLEQNVKQATTTPDTMQNDQWLNWLRSNKVSPGGRNEAEQSGLTHLLKNDLEGRTTKNDILNHIQSNDPNIKVIMKKELPEDKKYETIETVDGDYAVIAPNGRPEGRFNDYREANRYENSLNDNTIYSDWRTPGGKNYKEIVLSTPNKEISFDDYMKQHGKNFTSMSEEAKDHWLTSYRNDKNTPAYKSMHWNDVDNPVVHLRMDDRINKDDGSKVLHIGESQSDWGQDARKYGLKGESNDKDAVSFGPYIGDTENWSKIGFKHALKHAVDNGYDYISWSNGDQQKQIYDLSKHLSDLHYSDNKLRGYDHDGSRVINETAEPHQLDKHIGKAAANKLLAQDPDEMGVKRLSGLDLKVGGEGMEGYYDNMYPNFANDVVKQLGVKPQTADLHFDIPNEYRHMESDRPEYDTKNLVRPAHTSTNKGIKITPELREAVLKNGIPKFKKGGAVSKAQMRVELDNFKGKKYG